MKGLAVYQNMLAASRSTVAPQRTVLLAVHLTLDFEMDGVQNQYCNPCTKTQEFI